MDTDRLMSVVDFPALRVSTPLHSPIGALIRLSDLSLPIFWIGEQWAVTAFGIECLVRSYAIAKDRLWENEPDYSWSRHMAEKGWVDTADFDAAFAFAARHFADLRGALMSKPIIFGDTQVEAEAHSAPWQKTHGTYLAGRAAVDEADALAVTMERKWGAGRLRLIVPADLREKFDRQRYKFNHAIWHGELEEVRTQARRMVAAWKALDATATASGAQASDPEVWEVVLEDGSVAAIVQDNSAAHHVISNSDRRLRVYTLAEIGRLLSNFPAIAAIKDEFPGASVERVNEPRDPLDGIDRTYGDLDDEVPAF